MALVVVLGLTLLSAFQLSVQQGVDRTLERGASGADVVKATVNKIQNVFGDDQQFLRRIAYVESKDGTDSNTYQSGYHGGIWQVDEIGFQGTQDIRSHPRLPVRYEKIRKEFGIDWSSVQWSDLRIPLYSGIAARLILLNIPETIPCDKEGQATYWKTYYNTDAGAGTASKFLMDLDALDANEGCRVSSDIMIVLDESGSIGSVDFESAKQFVLQYISSLRIGPNDNRVGVITFSNSARLRFGFGAYSNASSLEQAVMNINYGGGGTNIPDGLCAMLNAFLSGDARTESTVFRVGIVMTDGQSNEDFNSCGFSSVAEAANAIHNAPQQILVFAFGVGSGFNRQDVEDIASGPEFVSAASSFSVSQLECIQTNQEEKICNKISRQVPTNNTNSGTLNQGEQARWELSVPTTGLSITLGVTEGRVTFYASLLTTAPSEAFHQWRLDVIASIQTINLIPQDFLPSRSKRNIAENVTLVPVYTTIIGLNERNAFSLSTSEQLVPEDSDGGVNLAVAIAVPVAAVAVIAGVILIVVAAVFYRRRQVAV